jgi:Ribbon-helix-helix protein, copG family
MQTGKHRRTQIAAAVHPELKRLVRHRAADENRSPSEIVRLALTRYLAESPDRNN